MLPSASPHRSPGWSLGWRGFLSLMILGATVAAASGPIPTSVQEEQDDGDAPLERGGKIEPPFAEGPLSNDAFLPLDGESRQDLEEAERALGEATEAAAEGARQRALGAAFQAWARVAGRLAQAAPPEGPGRGGIPAGPEENDGGPTRLSEGLASALRRSVAALSPERRELWRGSFEAVARLDGTSTTALAWPGTVSAARAALGDLDRALESGRVERATARLQRARALAALLDAHPERAVIEAALARRTAELQRWRGESSTTPPAWQSASDLELKGSIQLLDRELPVVPSQAAPGRGARPGLVAVDERTLFVQTASSLWRVELNREGRPLRADAVSLDRLLGVSFGSLARPRTGREAPGWELAPKLYNRHLFVVHGAREGLRSPIPNAIARLPIPELVGGSLGGDLRGGLLIERAPDYQPEWVLSGDLLWRPSADPSGRVERIPALAPLAEAEWQPGFAFVDDVLVVQARVLADRTEAWLVGLDPRDGTYLWKRRTGGGAGLASAQNRFARAAVPRASAPPLLVANGLVLCPTQLGFQTLIDPEQGELLWTLATRRRDAAQPGWSLCGPFAAEGDRERALLAPPDSDRLYPLSLTALQSTPDGAPALPLAGPILHIGTAEALLGAAGDAAAVLRRDGRERTVSLLSGPGEAPLDAFHLGPEEIFRGRALVSQDRILVSTDRSLYLLDGEHDLFLLAAPHLGVRGRMPGGDVFFADPWVIVLGFDALWVFQSTP